MNIGNKNATQTARYNTGAIKLTEKAYLLSGKAKFEAAEKQELISLKT